MEEEGRHHDPDAVAWMPALSRFGENTLSYRPDQLLISRLLTRSLNGLELFLFLALRGIPSSVSIILGNRHERINLIGCGAASLIDHCMAQFQAERFSRKICHAISAEPMAPTP